MTGLPTGGACVDASSRRLEIGVEAISTIAPVLAAAAAGGARGRGQRGAAKGGCAARQGGASEPARSIFSGDAIAPLGALVAASSAPASRTLRRASRATLAQLRRPDHALEMASSSLRAQPAILSRAPTRNPTRPASPRDATRGQLRQPRRPRSPRSGGRTARRAAWRRSTPTRSSASRRSSASPTSSTPARRRRAGPPLPPRGDAPQRAQGVARRRAAHVALQAPARGCPRSSTSTSRARAPRRRRGAPRLVVPLAAHAAPRAVRGLRRVARRAAARAPRCTRCTSPAAATSPTPACAPSSRRRRAARRRRPLPRTSSSRGATFRIGDADRVAPFLDHQAPRRLGLRARHRRRRPRPRHPVPRAVLAAPRGAARRRGGR